MKLLKYIPLQLTFFLILGILTGFYLSITLKIIIATLGFLIVVLLLLYRYTTSVLYNGVTFLIFFAIGISSSTLQNDLNKKQHYTLFTSEEHSVKAIITIKTILKPNDYYNRYEAEVLKVNNQNTQGKVLVNIKKDSLKNSLNIDDKFFTNVHFQAISKPKNPYQFNYKNYLVKQQIHSQVTIARSAILVVENKEMSLNGLAHKFRVAVNKSLKKANFKDDELAIVNALLLGQRQEMSKEIIENYAKAGAIHILAVSGLHVGIILLILTFFLKPLARFKHGKHIKLIVTILLLWAFAFIAGMSASVVRAVTMFSALSIGLEANRAHSIYKNLIISVFFLLLFNPYYLFDVGFQLSYLAVFFIVWVQPILYKIWKPKLKPIDYFWKLFTVSLAAQIGVLPLSLYYFHQFPGLFFMANLVIIPVLGIILGLGLAIIFLGFLDFIPQFLANFYQEIIGLMNRFVSWIAHQESFLFQNITFSLFLMLSLYFLIIFSFRWMETKTINRFKYVMFALILVQSVFIYEKYKVSSEKEFIIFNKSRHSVLAQRNGNKLIVYTDVLRLRNSVLKTYKVGSGINTEAEFHPIRNIYQLNKEKLLVIDSLGIYKLNSLKPDCVLLRQSPKINLERLIHTLTPKIIIADASNYKNYVARWRATCLENNIAFYYTKNDGAFIRKL